MAVHIRLARAGTTKTPFYRIVVADQRSPRGGILEKEGSVEVSNVALWCGKCVAPRRSRALEEAGAKKRRVCIKCGTVFETT